MQTPTYQGRVFAAGSAVALAVKGGAVLRGFWISSATATGTFVAKDGASANAAALVPSTIVGVTPGWRELGGIGCGTGLFVTMTSCAGTVVYAPSSALA